MDSSTLPPELAEWRAAKAFGWSHAQIDEAPGGWLDWMLAIENVHDQIVKEQQSKERNA